MSERLAEFLKKIIILLTGIFAAYLLVISLFATVMVFDGGEYYVKDTPLFSVLVIAIITVVIVLAKTGIKDDKGIADKTVEREKTERGIADKTAEREKTERGIADKAVEREKTERGIADKAAETEKVDKGLIKRYFGQELCERIPGFWIAAIVFLIAGLWFVLSVNLIPEGDQLVICNGAVGLRKFDYSLFSKGNYYDYWPFQARITLFLRLFFNVFGDSNYRAFQIFNVVCTIYSLVMIVKMAGESKVGKAITLIACGLFFPFIMYSTYIYGNTAGFACMMTSAYFMLKYFRDHSKLNGLLCVLFCGIGIWLKNSYQVVMIAIILMILADILRSGKKTCLRGILLIALIVLFTACAGRVSDKIVENRLGFPLSKGSPMMSWITMAFGEEEDGDPVRYDAYNIDVYMQNDMDSEKAAVASLKEFKNRIAVITDTPGHFLRFMSRKIARCWNDPTFEAISVNRKGAEVSTWPDSLSKALSERENNPLLAYLNVFQSVVLFGIVLYAFKRFHVKIKAVDPDIFFCLCFVGGFCFLLFWETLSQYALVYFLMMIPVSVKGYDALGDYVSEKAKNLYQKNASYQEDGLRQENRLYQEDRLNQGDALHIENKETGEIARAGKGASIPLGIIITIVIVTLASSVKEGTLGEIFHPVHDTTAFLEDMEKKEVFEEEIKGLFENGRYVLSPVSMPGYGITSLGERSRSEEENKSLPLAIAPIDEDNSGAIDIFHEYNYDLIRIEKTQLLLSAVKTPEETDSGKAIPAGQDFDDAMWRIAYGGEDEAGAFYVITIFDGAWCLCADGEEVIIVPFTGEKGQYWRIY